MIRLLLLLLTCLAKSIGLHLQRDSVLFVLKPKFSVENPLGDPLLLSNTATQPLIVNKINKKYYNTSIPCSLIHGYDLWPKLL